MPHSIDPDDQMLRATVEAGYVSLKQYVEMKLAQQNELDETKENENEQD